LKPKFVFYPCQVPRKEKIGATRTINTCNQKGLVTDIAISLLDFLQQAHLNGAKQFKFYFPVIFDLSMLNANILLAKTENLKNFIKSNQ